MPASGAEEGPLTTLETFQHELFTSPEIGRLLDELAPLEESLAHDDPDGCLIRVTRRRLGEGDRVPT